MLKDHEDSAMVTIQREEEDKSRAAINESETFADQELPIITPEPNQMQNSDHVTIDIERYLEENNHH